jgi:D-3-phosphoglycerate dehydrogenase
MLDVEFVPLDDLLAQSDVVSVNVSLTDDTRGMIGEREFALMKSGAIFLNGARGQIVETGALIAALQSGKLAGAGLDVFDTEPLPADHPILACQQVVLTPHIADQTPEGVELLNVGVVDNVIAFLKGSPQDVVTWGKNLRR